MKRHREECLQSAVVEPAPGIHILCRRFEDSRLIMLNSASGRYLQLDGQALEAWSELMTQSRDESTVRRLDSQSRQLLEDLELASDAIDRDYRPTAAQFFRYIGGNLRAQVATRARGWKSIRTATRRYNCRERASAADCRSPECVDRLRSWIVCARVSAILPFVSTNCINVAPAMARSVESDGLRCRLEVGSLNYPFQAHLWVSSHSMILDPAVSSAYRSIFASWNEDFGG